MIAGEAPGESRTDVEEGACHVQVNRPEPSAIHKNENVTAGSGCKMRAKSIVSLFASAAFSMAAASAAFAAELGPAPSADMFKSKNFYADQANWSNPAYFRCNTPAQLDQMTNPKGGPGVRATGAAGNCAVDTPRARIASPYPYKTAQEHYDAPDGPGQGARRPDRLYPGPDAGLGRLLHARRGGEPRFGLALRHRGAGPDGAFGADARISDPHGPGALSRGRRPRAGEPGRALLSGRTDALVDARRRRRGVPGADGALEGAVPLGRPRQLPAPGPDRPDPRRQGCRSGTARPSASGTARRSSPTPPTPRNGP